MDGYEHSLGRKPNRRWAGQSAVNIDVAINYGFLPQYKVRSQVFQCLLSLKVIVVVLVPLFSNAFIIDVGISIKILINAFVYVLQAWQKTLAPKRSTTLVSQDSLNASALKSWICRDKWTSTEADYFEESKKSVETETDDDEMVDEW